MTALAWAVAACLALGMAALWWLPRARPRVWPQITAVACEHMAMTVTATEARKKKWRCDRGCVMTEGYIAYARDVDHALDIATEVDRAKAGHLNAAMLRAEHPWTHLTDEEAADCVICSPTGPPLRREGGDET